MADTKDSVLDKAESVARRILERLGSKVGGKPTSASEHQLSPQVISDLASRIERVVESNLQEDQDGIRHIAPNRFKVMFTYEETSALTPQYIEAVGKELTAMVFEYINNRRYITRGPVELEASRDLFAKTTTVKASFDSDTNRAAGAQRARSVQGVESSKSVCFNSSDGRSFRVELRSDGAPAYVGRAAGSSVRIDDPSVSRLHCSLTVRTDGSVVVADVGSANGSYLNEQLLGPDEARSLNAGDVVGVGDFRLTVSEIS
jgi:hypothetical protein